MQIILLFLQLTFLFGFDHFFDKISDYNIYEGNPHNLQTTDEFIPYELITPLFTDYAWKHRAIYIPKGKKIKYNTNEVFNFPIGSIISKTFYYPHDFNNPKAGISLKETRIFIHELSGWVGLPYIWNKDETEAYLEISGGITNAEWTNFEGKKQQIKYIIPNMNQCMGCHMDKTMNTAPIGPKARNINSNYNYGKNEIKNQLIKWNELGYFEILDDYHDIPKIEKWNDSTSGTLNGRARAWLDVNCAHCHNVNGSANNTGLYLDYLQTDLKKIGIFKTPVAAGRGSGHLKYDIVPGHPEKSILVYRFESTDPGIMMPELGRVMVHEEGLSLIKEWILSLD